MKKLKILSIVGTRPNFIKIAALQDVFHKHPLIAAKILHTGQHYDENMSSVFFRELNIPKPHFFLNVNTGSPTWQQAKIMLKFESILKSERPDLVLVVGDVNATVACSMVAAHAGIKVAHIEAGLRSEDRSMPEEINRILTDAISEDLFVTEPSGRSNLLREGKKEKNIHSVGNVMIDTLVKYYPRIKRKTILKKLGIKSKDYILITIHRPSNVDKKSSLLKIIRLIQQLAIYKKVVFPIHPRTRKSSVRHGLNNELENINKLYLLDPQPYLSFLHLMDNASLVITDSGGVQEETTFMKIPCLSIRKSTERPITIETGTNILIKEFTVQNIMIQIQAILNGETKKGEIPALWDGHAAKRITQILLKKYMSNGIQVIPSVNKTSDKNIQNIENC